MHEYMLLIPLHLKRKLSVCHFKKTFCTRRLFTYNKISDFFLGTNTVKQTVAVIQIFLGTNTVKQMVAVIQIFLGTNTVKQMVAVIQIFIGTNSGRDLGLSWDTNTVKQMVAMIQVRTFYLILNMHKQLQIYLTVLFYSSNCEEKTYSLLMQGTFCTSDRCI